MDGKTALYRLFAGDGTLLYVGITKNVESRMANHAREKTWWPDVARKTFEWHEDRIDAVIVESRVIKAEGPRWNIAIPDERGRWRPSDAISPGRPRTGQTPVRPFRISAKVWEEAQANAKAEGQTMTVVVYELLRRYNAAAARRRKTAASVAHHLDADPRNNDPANLELRDQPDAP